MYGDTAVFGRFVYADINTRTQWLTDEMIYAWCVDAQPAVRPGSDAPYPCDVCAAGLTKAYGWADQWTEWLLYELNGQTEGLPGGLNDLSMELNG
jgi:hypothetical protein